MPVVVVIFVSALVFAFGNLITVRDNQRQEGLAATRHARTIALAKMVQRYIDEKNGIAPTSITAMAATAGFEDASQFQNSAGPHGEGPFLATYSMDNGVNTYQRVIVYDTPMDGSISAADYLSPAFNKCGATSAGQFGDWCGDDSGSWWIGETLNRIPDELSKERLQQQQTLQKFAKVYSVVVINRQVFPDPGTGDGSAVTLISQLSGYTMTAATCAGTWVWKNVPLTCDDLYTVWGTPRVYNYKNEDFISLYAEAPWKENGQSIVVSSQLDNRR